MNLDIHIPESIARALQTHWGDVNRRALEAIVADAYRAGILTAAEVGRALGLKSRWDVDAFLLQWNAPLSYTEADLDQDLHTLRRAKGT